MKNEESDEDDEDDKDDDDNKSLWSWSCLTLNRQLWTHQRCSERDHHQPYEEKKTICHSRKEDQ
ncbi:uncharacterized protein V6R79_003179 [Siganus canaliculatus]